MDATTLTPDSPLPDDVPTLHALVRQLLAEMARLRQKLDEALRRRFGRSSERQRVAPQKKAEPAKARPHGRAALPEHLERRVVVHDLSEEQKLCPCCGKQRACIGEQATEQLDLEPAVFFVLRTVRKSYACQSCDPQRVPPAQRIETAGPAQVGPVAKGLCGPGLLAHAITARFADHTPTNRLAGQLARSGVTIARSTLGDWLAAAADLLSPLVLLMRQRVLLSRVIHSDDTGVKLRVPGAKEAKRTHLWAYIGDADFPYVVLDYRTDYSGEGPQEFLKGYEGYLQADALAQYEGLYGPGHVEHVCCWAHARRKFVEAKEGGDERAEAAVGLIGKLYAVERELPALLLRSEEPVAQQRRLQREEQRQQARQRQAVPILTELKQWLDGQRPKALPKSALGQAITYAQNNWEALGRYCERGYLAIDNNLSERTLRAVALGRKNWVALGGESGGRTAAALYSVVLSCKHLGLDPFRYLREALMGVFALGDAPTAEQLAQWLPDRWLSRQGQPATAAG